MHAAKDYSGSEIMRTIRDEFLNLKIPVVEFTSAVELLKDEKGQVAGAVLLNMETGDYSCLLYTSHVPAVSIQCSSSVLLRKVLTV